MNTIDAQLAKALNDAGQGIQIIDSHGRVVYANKTAARLAGFESLDEYLRSSDQFKGTLVIDETGLPIHLEGLPHHQVLKDHQVHTKVFRIRYSGSQDRFSLLVRASPVFDSSGNLEFVCSTMIDLTEQLHAEGKIIQNARRTEMLDRFSQTVAEAGLEYPDIIMTVVNSIHRLTGDICIIHLRTSNGRWLEPAVALPPDPRSGEIAQSIATLLKKNPGGFFNDDCTKDQSRLIVYPSQGDFNFSNYPNLISLFKQYLISSAVILPLCLHSQVFGSVILLRTQPGPAYTEEDRQAFQDLTDRAALAIENARLYAIERQRARELNALHQATLALLTTIDLDILLGQILDAAMTAIPAAEKGELHLIAKDTGKLEIRAALGYRDTRIKSLLASKIQWYTARAIQERQSLLIKDASPQPGDSSNQEYQEEEAIRSIVIAPLILSEEVLGALTLSSNKISAFTESNRNLLVSFAATTTEALHNAQLHAEVQKLAITDPLTNLYNRRGFFEIGRREIQRARRFKHPLSAIMLDIDHFKDVNDTFGHGVGDRILVTLAVNLQNSVRSVDILGRYGGDEFVILLPETDLFTANAVAERLRQCATESQVVTDRGVVSITISIGISKAVADTQDLTSLLESADTALYFAKQHGRNRVEVN